MNAIKLILPGLFLLLLGVGNIGVGSFKSAQYQQVLDELSELHEIAAQGETSALRRIQLSDETDSRHLDRLEKAKGRRDFYELVIYGGKVFVGVSLIFFLGGILLHTERKLIAESAPRPEVSAL